MENGWPENSRSIVPPGRAPCTEVVPAPPRKGVILSGAAFEAERGSPAKPANRASQKYHSPHRNNSDRDDLESEALNQLPPANDYLYSPIFLIYSPTAGSTNFPSGFPAAAASRIAVADAGCFRSPSK